MTLEQLEKRRLQKQAAQRVWLAKNKAKMKEYQTAWYIKHLEYRAQYAVKYMQERRQHDAQFRLLSNLRSLTCMSFKAKGWGKTTKTQELLGCTFEEFAVHLQSKFKEGMTLENHGDWHIDHIKPCATATSAEELAALFHFTNLQPLWATENLSKGSKYYV